MTLRSLASSSAILMAGLILAGCSVSAPFASPALGRQHSSYRAHPPTGNLLYVDAGYMFNGKFRGRVAILTYPGYSLVSEFTVAKNGYPIATTDGMCTDANGDVFIEASYYGGSTIFKYNHGGTTPIASLDVGSYIAATDCARDPSTGNLAVTSYGGPTMGNVAIFANAMGSPKYYTYPGMLVYASCTYDKAGDLFIDGYNTHGVIIIAELPYGGSTFTKISLNHGLKGTGALQWIGNDLSVQDGSVLYTISISGSSGTVVGTTTLFGKAGGGLAYVFGKNVIAPDYRESRKDLMGVWRHSKTGKPLTFVAGDVRKPFSEVVSVAPKGI